MRKLGIYAVLLALLVFAWGCGVQGGFHIGDGNVSPGNSDAAFTADSGQNAALDGRDADVIDPNSPSSSGRKIVVFREGTPESVKLDVSSRHGARVMDLSLINAHVVIFPDSAAVHAVSADPNVLRVDDDAIRTVNAVEERTVRASSQPSQIIPWGISRVSAPQSWPVSSGAGVKVAIIDTGISLSHPDLTVYGGANFVNSRNSPNDDNGHGTHVSGIAAGLNNSIGVVGVGNNARLYAVKVLNRNGSGYDSTIIKGIQWCISNGIKVTNMSFGGTVDDPSLHAAIIQAYNAGITQVAAAGNSGGSVIYPAVYPEVIAVSALDQTDNIAYFSSRGPQVALIAPGVNIYSTYLNGGYATLSGTSMASPHVAGAAALKIAQNPALTPAGVKAALQSTADVLPGLTTAQQGAGLINCYKLVTSP